MLVLARKVGETVKIGDDIYITLLSIKNNQVRLGFKANKNTPVNRVEVLSRDNPKPNDK